MSRSPAHISMLSKFLFSQCIKSKLNEISLFVHKRFAILVENSRARPASFSLVEKGCIYAYSNFLLVYCILFLRLISCLDVWRLQFALIFKSFVPVALNFFPRSRNCLKNGLWMDY